MKLLEAAAAGVIVAAVAWYLARHVHGDQVLVPSVAFLSVFLVTLWQRRTTTSTRTGRRR